MAESSAQDYQFELHVQCTRHEIARMVLISGLREFVLRAPVETASGRGNQGCLSACQEFRVVIVARTRPVLESEASSSR